MIVKTNKNLQSIIGWFMLFFVCTIRLKLTLDVEPNLFRSFRNLNRSIIIGSNVVVIAFIVFISALGSYFVFLILGSQLINDGKKEIIGTVKTHIYLVYLLSYILLNIFYVFKVLLTHRYIAPDQLNIVSVILNLFIGYLLYRVMRKQGRGSLKTSIKYSVIVTLINLVFPLVQLLDF
ncbi:hypothetical protein [Lactiplantibacillus pentosus]|uniref:hypothetical protein n=1 Tax=Lactiplantibacillus pentosus TaxID=1589 RepID=UPI0013309182|nr:hypothetical protein [Lactiplantibacillus pentosus]MBQ0835501.1 hypothetical protein [Lactiplantibacillus pentosus]MBU7464955.1 hypothetical protein [Lactiplantibacillus pentosus]MBU7490959.1 hypothetical protein [Lactiplantibacillus pentosus]MBU7493957.1 hypothetical protein [Lactiplantibacillus pentosus]MBU7519955.1 hypothetical protein [Lactiplantibacillus pentosus]